MTEKQKRFCLEYLIDMNATQAYIRAGYSKNGARQSAEKLLTNTDIQNYIQEQLDKIESEKIAEATEVMQYLTAVMRGESSAEVVVVELQGDGYSRAKRMNKAPDEKERLKAAELLGKRYGMFTDKVNIEAVVPVFGGEEDLED